jgi:general secretion pathway protein M
MISSYWNSLQPRERRVLIAGAVALFLLIAYAGIWEPYRSGLQELRESVVEKRELRTWMQQAANEIQRLRGIKGRGGNGGAKSSGSLLALVDSTARGNQLGDALKRIQPDGQDAVRVWLEEAKFDDVLRWFESLRRQQGLIIDEAVVERLDVPGRVNVRVVLARSAA